MTDQKPPPPATSPVKPQHTEPPLQPGQFPNYRPAPTAPKSR